MSVSVDPRLASFRKRIVVLHVFVTNESLLFLLSVFTLDEYELRRFLNRFLNSPVDHVIDSNHKKVRGNCCSGYACMK